MGPQALGPQIINGIVMPASVWDSREKLAVEEIRSHFGEQRAGQQRHIGFSISLTPTLNLKPEQLKAQVLRALDLAERNNIPVFFHLDDQHFWWQSPELSKNPEMLEWSDFPKPGERHGPVVPSYWLSWGDPAAVYPAPPPCFACQPFKAALAQRLKECVAEPIVQRLVTWKSQGKEYLFAGVVTGNETSVPDFRRGYDGFNGKAEDAAGLDSTRFPALKVRMSKADLVPVGYHSLYAMGHNQQSIERLAHAEHKSVSDIVQELMYQVAHDYAEFQAKTLNQAGLPKERIYTHFTSTGRTVKTFFEDHLKELERTSPSSKPGSNNLPPPFESAVNHYSRPGFTVVSDGVDLNELGAQLRKAHAPDDGKAWAAVESYACSGQPGPPQTEKQYEEYLGGLFAHGAKVVNVYGWNIPTTANSPYAIMGSGVIPAVKKWLAGERLPATWFRAEKAIDQKTAIQSKMKKLQDTAHEAVARGLEPQTVQGIVKSFEREFEPLLKAGKWAESEAALDRAISRLQAKP